MRILLLVLGLLAMASGGLKFRDRIRTRIGTSPFSLAELALGLIACLTAAMASEPAPAHNAVAGLTVLAMIFAGVHQSKLTSAFRHRRDLSESHRLRQYVELPTPPASSPEQPTRPRSLTELAAQADKTAVRSAAQPHQTAPRPKNSLGKSQD